MSGYLLPFSTLLVFSLIKEVDFGIYMADTTGSCEVMISFNGFLKENLVRETDFPYTDLM